MKYSVEINLKFKLNELLYDIRTIAKGIADSSDTLNENAKVALKDIGEEDTFERVKRIIENDLAFCREKIFSYTKQEAKQTTVFNNTKKNSIVYAIDMKVPEDFSETTVEVLRTALHEHIVYKVLYKCLSIYCPNETNLIRSTDLNMDNSLTDIRNSLSSRIGKVHIKSGPF